MRQSRQDTTFSDLKGLEKLSKKKSNPSSLSKLLGLINKTVYQVQDDSYGIGFHKWEGEVIEIDEKIFPNGKGYFHYKDGTKIQKEILSFQDTHNNIYTGGWKDDKKHGRGKAAFPNGDIYNGQWKDDMQHGKGKMIYPDGTSYEGQWIEGKPHGRGKFTSNKGYSYEGEWIEGKQEGDVKCTYKNGNVYKGGLENDKPHGQGTMKYANGDTYEGEWENGKRHGKGKFTFPNGDIYDGEWRNGMRHGEGKYSCPNGNVYEGQWQDNMQNGQGKMIYPDGTSYEGQWIEGKPHGLGKFTFKKGHSYEGEWENGKPHGKGKMIYPNGDYYQGKFENGFAIDFSKIIITDSNNKPHTITKKNGLYYQAEGNTGKKIDIDIENKEILKSFLLQFGNIQSNQEDTKKMKDPEELRKFIEESEYVRLPHEFNVICEKLKELRNESKGDESLSDQKPGLLINTSSCEQVTNWLSKIISEWCC